jgi:hypothetical protein
MTDRFSTDDRDLHDASFGELFKKLSAETSELIRQEMTLARAELTEKGKEAGKGAGLFGGAGVVGLLAAGALTAAIILVLATFLPDWVAALNVAVVYGAASRRSSRPPHPSPSKPSRPRRRMWHGRRPARDPERDRGDP